MMKMHNPPHAGEVLRGALPLSRAFDTSAERWLNQQLQSDLWHAEKSRKHLLVVKLSAA